MSLAIKFEADAKYPVWTTQGQDHKAWAKRILYRAERGDRDITVLHLQKKQWVSRKFRKQVKNIVRH